MAQPILHLIKSWDAKNEGNISFLFSGNQVFKNQLIIRNNATNATVYDQTQTSFQLKHVIEANSLENNTCYNAQLRVFDKDNIASAWSQMQIFYCFDTPVFIFADITSEQTIKNSAIEAKLKYEQIVDPINTYQFFLYNEQKVLLNKSQIKYDASMSFTYTGLEDKNKYFIRATGETLNHIELDTGYIEVSVLYVTPSAFYVLDLTNIHKQGLIKIHSNMVSIEGKSSPSPPVFINSMVNLTNKNSWVLFDEGYEINGDFTLQVDTRALIQNGQTLILRENSNSHIEVKYILGQSESVNRSKGCFILRAYTNGRVYTQSSDYFEPTKNIMLWLRRVNHVYEIKALTNEVIL